ncbi:MAG: hypothetical protein KA230_12150 [Flavobacteriales bacterium]|nr:hypothetical protein [Flavobacteriales bacterium]
MDGSFAFAFLLVVLMTVVNFGLLLFCTSMLALRKQMPTRKLLVSAIIALVGTMVACLLGYHQLVGAGTDADPSFSQPAGVWVLYGLFATNVLGTGAFGWLVFKAFRRRSNAWMIALKVLGLLLFIVHALATSAALWVLWWFLQSIIHGQGHMQAPV